MHLPAPPSHDRHLSSVANILGMEQEVQQHREVDRMHQVETWRQHHLVEHMQQKRRHNRQLQQPPLVTSPHTHDDFCHLDSFLHDSKT